MDLNYLITGSTESNFIKEDFINKLAILPYNYTQNTINNSIEKYYSQVETSLLIDDYTMIYIRFFTPHMITSEEEYEFYKQIGYTPLTKKYFYK